MKSKEETAKDLALETANTAVVLATTASKTAADLAAKTAESTTEIRTNMAWMMKSLSSIEQTLSEMQKAFVTSAQHAEVITELSDHEERLRNNERNLQYYAGGLFIISFTVPILLKIFIKGW